MLQVGYPMLVRETQIKNAIRSLGENAISVTKPLQTHCLSLELYITIAVYTLARGVVPACTFIEINMRKF